MKISQIKKLIIYVLSVIVLVALDQITKAWAVAQLKGQPSIVLIKGVLEFFYIQNDGAAWGMLSGGRIFFLITTPVIVILLACIIFKTPNTKKYAPLLVVITILTAGALGNYIDRLLNGYVHDFIYFSLVDFPVFNVADMYVVISVILFSILFLFVYKDDNDFSFLKLKKDKINE